MSFFFLLKQPENNSHRVSISHKVLDVRLNADTADPVAF